MFNNETTAFVSIMAQNERADRERKLRKNRVLAAGAWSIRPKLDRMPSHQLELKLGRVHAKLDQATNEIYNGRLAMLAITGFAVQENLWGSPVVDLPISGFFFGR